MVSRADRVTTGRKQQDVYYSDFLDSFAEHPSTGAISRVINENSVKQAVKNLVLTSAGERPFQPTVGGGVRKLLFEPISQFTADSIRDAIAQTLFNNEPRIESLQVGVAANPDVETYTVAISFKLRNLQTGSTFELVLERNR